MTCHAGGEGVPGHRQHPGSACAPAGRRAPAQPLRCALPCVPPCTSANLIRLLSRVVPCSRASSNCNLSFPWKLPQGQRTLSPQAVGGPEGGPHHTDQRKEGCVPQALCVCNPCPGGQLRDLQALLAVFVAREGRLLGALAGKMAKVKGGEEVFETWMKGESDLVQATALAYAEREVLQASMRVVEQVPIQHTIVASHAASTPLA